MASSPRFKVYDSQNRYLASFIYLIEAIRYVQSCTESGFTVRDGHSTKNTRWHYVENLTESWDEIENRLDDQRIALY